jgi:hypothetical protein
VVRAVLLQQRKRRIEGQPLADAQRELALAL